MLKFNADNLSNWASDYYADFHNLEFSVYGKLLKVYEHELLMNGKDGYSICSYFVENEDGYLGYIEAYVNDNMDIYPPMHTKEYFERVLPLIKEMIVDGGPNVIGRVVCADFLFAIKCMSTISINNEICLKFDFIQKKLFMKTKQVDGKTVTIAFHENEDGEYYITPRNS